MHITSEDRRYYSAAIDFVTEHLEIIGNFSKLNGLPSFPGEELSDVVITGIKTWLLSEEGEQWLRHIGYGKDYTIQEPHDACFCPVCSGTYGTYESIVCERCGREVCNPCTTVVDKRYHIEWCHHCISAEPLINLVNLSR
jgi:hypothetical protein